VHEILGYRAYVVVRIDLVAQGILIEADMFIEYAVTSLA